MRVGDTLTSTITTGRVHGSKLSSYSS